LDRSADDYTAAGKAATTDEKRESHELQARLLRKAAGDHRRFAENHRVYTELSKKT